MCFLHIRVSAITWPTSGRSQTKEYNSGRFFWNVHMWSEKCSVHNNNCWKYFKCRLFTTDFSYECFTFHVNTYKSSNMSSSLGVLVGAYTIVDHWVLSSGVFYCIELRKHGTGLVLSAVTSMFQLHNLKAWYTHMSVACASWSDTFGVQRRWNMVERPLGSELWTEGVAAVCPYAFNG
jgi:hypothetical protein